MYDYANKIKFLRHYNIGLDESYVYANTSGEYYSNLTANFYLARGYVQNTWTYEDTLHFTMASSIATSNAAEEVAYLAKRIDNSDLTLTKEELSSGKVNAKIYSYNGWMSEAECDIIVVSKDDASAKVLLYYYQDGDYPYGLYSQVVNVDIK